MVINQNLEPIMDRLYLTSNLTCFCRNIVIFYSKLECVHIKSGWIRGRTRSHNGEIVSWPPTHPQPSATTFQPWLPQNFTKMPILHNAVFFTFNIDLFLAAQHIVQRQDGGVRVPVVRAGVPGADHGAELGGGTRCRLQAQVKHTRWFFRWHSKFYECKVI